MFSLEGNEFFGSNKQNGANITENSFAPIKEPHRAQLSFSGDLKHFQLKFKV